MCNKERDTPVHKPFRFGAIIGRPRSREEWITCAHKMEDYGYAVFLMPDHFVELFSPIPALMSVADATSTLRIGSFVFDNDFRHPVVLAREAATLDVLSNGRFELGLGAGWMRSEYDQVGIPFDEPRVRVDRLEEAVHIVKSLSRDEPLNFSGQYYHVSDLRGYPRPVQQPRPPIFIGSGGKRMLRLAAREADIVGITATVHADGSGLDTRDILPEATDQKIAHIRQEAGERFADLELNAIVYSSTVTNDHRSIAEQWIKRIGEGATVEQVLASPHLLMGDVEQICDALWEHRERYGISYFSIFEESMEALAPVVSRLAGK
jgi:probable F420-dependent oxidoreductase